MTTCVTDDHILQFALGRSAADLGNPEARHIESCHICLDRVRELRAIVAQLHGNVDTPSSGKCLDDDQIALLAGGNGQGLDRPAMEHVSQCADCRGRVAAVVALNADHLIKEEIEKLDRSRVLSTPRWSRPRIAMSAGIAAAAVATIVVLGPVRSSKDASLPPSSEHRDVGITTTSAPRLLTQPVVTGDVIILRWTSVPEADIYRVRVWNTDGTVAWSTETRDTTAALPRDIKRDSYLWEVKARTGWDRWVSSEFTELSIRSSRAR